jgi:hypothetical protein
LRVPLRYARSKVTRRIGDVQFRFNGRQGASPVIFGQKDDSILLGSVSLEALRLMIDPLKRELRPLPMVLARLAQPRSDPEPPLPRETLTQGSAPA